MTHYPSMASFGHGRQAPISHPGALVLAPRYVLNYHPGTLNHCPGCSGTQWLIGRTTAQCARCDTALPLAKVAQTPACPLFISRSGGMA